MMQVRLTRYTNEPVLAIEEAAANCYDSIPSQEGKIMRACYKSGHGSVLEYVSFTWHISGVSRALLAQLTRHRHVSFAVRSQRYVNESQFGFVTPPSVLIDEKALALYNFTMETLQGVYDKLIAAGIPAEDARFVLPNACETVIECNMNLRELIHFCNERLCSRAQWEIRQLAQLMAGAVVEVMPAAIKYLVPKCEAKAPYCFCTESKSCGRHPKLEEVFKFNGIRSGS